VTSGESLVRYRARWARAKSTLAAIFADNFGSQIVAALEPIDDSHELIGQFR